MRRWNWLYGPRAELDADGLSLRPMRLNATGVIAIRDELASLSNSPAQVHSGHGLNGSERIFGDIGDILALHPEQLKYLVIGTSSHSLQLIPGFRPRLTGFSAPPTPLLQLIDGVSRPRIRLRLLAAAAPLALPLVAGWALYVAIDAGADLAQTATSSAVLLVAIVLAGFFSVKLWEREKRRYPDSVVHPIRWVDAIANRAKAIYTVIGFISGVVLALVGALASAII